MEDVIWQGRSSRADELDMDEETGEKSFEEENVARETEKWGKSGPRAELDT